VIQTVRETRLTGNAGTPVVVFEPEKPGTYACVLVMPERYGLVRHITEQAQRRERTNVLGIFGEDDHVISISDIQRFRNELEKRNHSYQITMYPGVPHGWLNDTMPGRYRPEAYRIATGRTRP